MARSRQSKESDLVELTALLASSKLTVAATYTGLSVLQLQELRKTARDSNTTIKVAKNRLIKKVVSEHPQLASADLSALNGQLVYAFNADDEVAPAQTLQQFAKTNPGLQFVAGINEEGRVYSAEEVTALASLPSKDQLRAQVVSTIAAPLSGLVGVLSGNLRGLVTVLQARQEKIEA